MTYIDTFERVEHKYLLTKNQAEDFYKEIHMYLKNDIYPQYALHNLYYDASDNIMIRRSIEGPYYKEKLRIRSYGEPSSDSFVYLEMKKKYAGIVYKRRIQLKEYEVNDFFENKLYTNEQIGNEIKYMKEFYDARPKMFIGYDRRAFAGIYEPDVRITFDTNIRYRLDHLSLHDDHKDEYLLNDEQVLMEIKVMNRYPLWLSQTLTKMKINRTSFSKYGEIYTNILRQEREGINYV